jgi:hypothetical protein
MCRVFSFAGPRSARTAVADIIPHLDRPVPKTSGLVSYQSAEPPSSKGKRRRRQRGDDALQSRRELAPELNEITVPAPTRLGRTVRAIGFLDARIRREIEALVDGRAAVHRKARRKRKSLRQKGNSKSPGLEPVTVPAPVQTRRRLRWIGFSDTERRSEGESVLKERNATAVTQ